MYARGLNLPEVCLYKWLDNKKCIGKTIIVFQSDFLTWLAKNGNGKTISRRHVTRVFHNLAERGFCEVKARGFGCFEVTLYSLNFALGLKNQDETNMPDGSKPQNVTMATDKPQDRLSDRGKQQQLIEIKKLCLSVGVNYRLEKDWWEVFNHGIEKIEAIVEMLSFKLARSRIPIFNPCGWFKQALRDNYYLDFYRHQIYTRL